MIYTQCLRFIGTALVHFISGLNIYGLFITHGIVHICSIKLHKSYTTVLYRITCFKAILYAKGLITEIYKCKLNK